MRIWPVFDLDGAATASSARPPPNLSLSPRFGSPRTPWALHPLRREAIAGRLANAAGWDGNGSLFAELGSEYHVARGPLALLIRRLRTVVVGDPNSAESGCGNSIR